MSSLNKLCSGFKILLTATNVLNATDLHASPDRASEWLERPWEIRYMLFISDFRSFNLGRIDAKTINAEGAVNGVETRYNAAEGLFKPGNMISVRSRSPVITVRISFDTAGHVTNADLSPGRWSGKRNLLDQLVLINEEETGKKPYRLAEWSQGIAGEMSFSPAVCAGWDPERALDDWNPNSRFGSFGCREWTAQLYDRDRPYIDVTSYAPGGPFIGVFVGWSRFEDPQKPVIGLHGSSWLCLHECPKGEKPGVIRDIKAWTKKHGFPMPERPPKQPLYPNADFIDDINEFSD